MLNMTHQDSGHLGRDDDLHGDRSVFIRLVCKSITRLPWSYLRHTPKLFQSQPASAPVLAPTSPLKSDSMSDTSTTDSWMCTTLRKPVVRLKISNDRNGLEEEYNLHVNIEWAFNLVVQKLGERGFNIVLPFIPHCIEFHHEILSSGYTNISDNNGRIDAGSAAYAMECIGPFNLNHIKYLVKRHLSPFVQDRAIGGMSTPSFVAEICLGDLAPLSDKWHVRLVDRLVYADQLHAEKVDVSGLSKVMGSALAILHWSCGLDAAGVKFILGCDKKGSIRLWLENFSNCRPFEDNQLDLSTQLVDAIMQNDSCWPRWINLRAFRDMWTNFRSAYIEMSALICEEQGETRTRNHVPQVFIDELEHLRGPPR